MPHRLQKLSENLNGVANSLIEYSHTLTSKVLAAVGATSAGTYITSKWYDPVYQFLIDWPWMGTLSFCAIVLLVIERTFIVWAWWRKYKRGEI